MAQIETLEVSIDFKANLAAKARAEVLTPHP